MQIPQSIYPPMGPEAEERVPRMEQAEAIKMVGMPDPRSGPRQFTNLAMMTRGEDEPLNFAKQRGWLNYLDEFDRVKRETEALNNMLGQQVAVKGQLDRIEDAKRQMEFGRMARYMAQTGMPFVEAAQKFPMAGTYKENLDASELLMKSRNPEVPIGTRRSALAARLKEITGAEDWPPNPPTVGGILGFGGLSPEELSAAQSEHNSRIREYNAIQNELAKIGGVPFGSPLPEVAPELDNGGVVTTVGNPSAQASAMSQPQSWSAAGGQGPVSGVQAATNRKWEVVDGKLVRVDNAQ